MSDIHGILRACHLFQSVEPRGLARLEFMSRVRSFRKGAVIFRQGQECPGIFVVERGLVRLYTLSPAGKEHVLHMMGPGQAFAEVAVIGGFACPATAEATESTACVFLPADPFRRALEGDHGLCLQLMAGLTARVRHFLSLLEDIVLRDASGRLARFLLQSASAREGHVVLPSLNRHLASHLNLTSETLSRILRRFTEARLIERLGNRKLRLVNPGGLRDLAEGPHPLL